MVIFYYYEFFLVQFSLEEFSGLYEAMDVELLTDEGISEDGNLRLDDNNEVS